MIVINGKAVKSFFLNGKFLSSMYKDGKLIWQAVRSCFGSGVWSGSKPWIGEEKWKRQK